MLWKLHNTFLRGIWYPEKTHKKEMNSREQDNDKVAWEKVLLAFNKTISSNVHSLTKRDIYRVFN